MQNCMVLALLAPITSNANGTLSLYSQGFSPRSVTVTENFSINITDPDFPNLARNVNETISGCFQQYCENSPDCGISPLGFCSRQGGRKYCYTDICNEYGSVTLNPDVGGIGVWRPYSSVIC